MCAYYTDGPTVSNSVSNSSDGQQLTLPSILSNVDESQRPKLRMAPPAPSLPVNNLLVPHASRAKTGAIPLPEDEAVINQKIEKVVLQLNLLKDMGLLVDLDITGLSLFTMNVALLELGVGDSDARGQRLRGGRRILIPLRDYNRILSTANALRRTLDTYSYNIAQFGGWRWIPYTAWRAFHDEFERRRTEWENLKAEIISNLARYRAEIESLADKIAEELWELNNIREKFNTYNELVGYIRGRIAQRFPDENRVRERLSVVVRTSILMTSADIMQERAAEVEAEARIKEIERQQRIAAAEERAKLERIRAETEAMRQAALEYAREQVARELAPFDAIFVDLRTRILQEAEEIYLAVTRNGVLNPKTRERLSELVETFKSLNVRDDKQLEMLLEQVRAAAQNCPVSVHRSLAPSSSDAAVKRLSQTLKTVMDACAETRQRYLADPRMDGIRII